MEKEKLEGIPVQLVELPVEEIVLEPIDDLVLDFSNMPETQVLPSLTYVEE